MAKKYNWLARLIDRITKSEQPNNDYFEYYNHRVTLQSGTRDYVSVWIEDMGIEFSFDFWTKRLCFTSYNDYDERDAIIKTFRRFYDNQFDEVYIGSDEPWEEAVKEYEQYLDPEEYDQDKVRPEYDAIMARKAA